MKRYDFDDELRRISRVLEEGNIVNFVVVEVAVTSFSK